MHTLAEGVETEEQYRFLREAGCEFIQGFYFGRPQPYPETMEQVHAKKLMIENRQSAHVWNLVGNINLQTDLPFAIVEDDGDSFRPIFLSRRFRQELRTLDFESGEKAIAELVKMDLPAAKQIISFLRVLEEDGQEHTIFVQMNTYFIRFGRS